VVQRMRRCVSRTWPRVPRTWSHSRRVCPSTVQLWRVYNCSRRRGNRHRRSPPV